MSENINLQNLNIAFDGGNGFIKARVNNQLFIYPSVLSRVLPGGDEPRFSTDEEDLRSLFSDFENQMDITVQSNAVKINGHYLVGNSASNSGEPLMTFNVNSNEGKSTADISFISLLSLAAYFALKECYQQEGSLPTNVDVHVQNLTTALPIDEMKLKGVRDNFIARFTQNKHVILINNFDNPITTTLTFETVALDPEGIIAERGLIMSPTEPILYRDDEIFDNIIKDYNLDSFDGQDVLEAGNVLGIDIGDGTVDFSVSNGTTHVPNMNTSILMGIGNIAENAVNALHQAYPMIGKVNRQEFMKIANRGDDRESQTYRSFLNDQVANISSLITEQVKSIYAKLNNQIGLIVVCGGGAVTLEHTLKPLLLKTIDDLSPFGAAKVLWISHNFAQTLNLDGLQSHLLEMERKNN